MERSTMDGLMMRYQLTIPAMARRGASLHAQKPVIGRRPDGSIQRTTYAEVLRRSRRLIGALRELGVGRGDRVATFCWNHQQHLEAYYGVAGMGAVVHTLNVRLAADDVAYIANHAGDSVVLVDADLWPRFEAIRPRIPARHVVVIGAGAAGPSGTLDYETLIAAATEGAFDDDLEEDAAAGMCYTSGTTGRPKGVVYSHRSMSLQSLALGSWDLEYVREREVVLAAVPMFHANAWGLPYASLLFGASQVLPGRFLDAGSLLGLIASERVTVFTGVPTIGNALLHALDSEPARHDVSSLRLMVLGGAAVPEAMIRAFEERHGIRVQQGWGMTEMSPFGSMATLTRALDHADEGTRFRHRASQGLPPPFIETRVRGEHGLAPWDGETMGELEVRGPWVARAYHDAPEMADRFTDDGWFRTGDMVTVDPSGYIFIRDRARDVIKSGGEWISSVALEDVIARHPAVFEAAVIGLRHPVWDERPLAIVVPHDGAGGAACSEADLLAFIAPHVPKFWLPSAVRFVNEIPRTSVGKYDKRLLRERFRDCFMAADAPRDESGAAGVPLAPHRP